MYVKSAGTPSVRRIQYPRGLQLRFHLFGRLTLSITLFRYTLLNLYRFSAVKYRLYVWMYMMCLMRAAVSSLADERISGYLGKQNRIFGSCRIIQTSLITHLNFLCPNRGCPAFRHFLTSLR